MWRYDCFHSRRVQAQERDEWERRYQVRIDSECTACKLCCCVMSLTSWFVRIAVLNNQLNASAEVNRATVKGKTGLLLMTGPV